jgi:hypothetical protein
MLRKRILCVLAATGVFGLTSCTNSFAPRRTEGESGNPNTPAGKVGKAAYKAGKEAEKAAKEAERKIDKAARDAQAGWKDAKKTSDN